MRSVMSIRLVYLSPGRGPDAAGYLGCREDIMQHAQARARSLKWIGRGALVSLAALAAFTVSPALPALAGTAAGARR